MDDVMEEEDDGLEEEDDVDDVDDVDGLEDAEILHDEHENDEGFDECAEPLTDFIAYIERTWLGKKVGRSGHRQVPLFPIDSWNKHNAVLNGEPLTNN